MDVDATQTDQTFVGNAGNRAPIDQTDLSRPITIADIIEAGGALAEDAL